MAASRSSIGAAANRVFEMVAPPERRIFHDPLAFRLLPAGWRLRMRVIMLPGIRQAVLGLRDRAVPGIWGVLLCRTRYIDDVVRRELEAGATQVVILGAGLDSRAYRLPGMEQARCFEVDLPGVMEFKKERVVAVLGALPEHVTWVGMDFDRQDLAEALLAAGYRREKRTLFVWEGVTQYISEEAVDATLRIAGRDAPPGSAIVFTYILKGIIDGSDCSNAERRLVAMTIRAGSAWLTGFRPAELSGYLAERGLELVEDVGAAEHRQRYLEPLGRRMTIFRGERIALARVR